MASLVLSEHAFPQGGITISKQHSHLKGDIVEVLQRIKCALRHDLLFCKPGPSSLIEGQSDKYEIEAQAGEISEDDEFEEEGWKALFLDEDEYDIESDIEMSGPYK